VVTARALGIESSDPSNAFVIAIQAGAIAAVLGLYRARVSQMVLGLAGRDPSGRALVVNVAIAFLPAAILGLSFDAPIERHLFGPWPIVGAWLVGGVAILVLSKRFPSGTGKSLETLTVRGALLVGLMQALALWPGTSRSLVTILGGLFAGLSMASAVEFSFLLGLVTLGAATGYKALGHGSEMLAAFGVVPVAIGFVAAWLSAVLSVRWLVGWLSHHGLTVFAWWRIGIGLVVGALLVANVL
jgi:undecaprenyl-diphosphatase